ncbi:MAG: PaaI family thioesterase [Proteobacteria bacterium]|nr:PaaI family thioesterase [Pseudomonadota bacterium]
MNPQERLAAALARIPYARFLGVRAELKGDELTLILPFADHLIGNPLLPALHGGVVGALMELTALTQLAIASKSEAFPKTIDISVDYLRSGKPADTFARARVVKVGRRIANVQAEAWQAERANPIAAMHGHFKLPDEGGAAVGMSD